MNEIYASGGKIQDGFWDALEIPDSIRSAYGSYLKDYAHNLNETAEAGGNAEASLQGLNNRLLEQGENIIEDTSLGEKFVDGLKSGGISLLKSLGTAGIDFAITAVLQAGLTLLDNWINREQIAIDNGKKAQTEIGNTFEEFSKGKTTMSSLGKEFSDSQDEIKTTGDAIDSVAEKYVKLSKGVNSKTNENVNLSDADYQSYLDLSNQLADLYPTLVSGYDIQGNAILNLSSNAKEAANSLKDLYDMQMLSSNATIGENLQQSYDGIMTQVKQYEKAIKSSKKTADEAGESIDNLNNNTTDYYKELTENGKIIVDSGDFGSLTDYNDFLYSITNAIKKSGIEPVLGQEIDSWNDELQEFTKGQEIILDTPIAELSTQQSELLQSNLAKMKSDSLNSLQVTKNEAEKETSATELLIQDQWKSLSDSLGQYLQTSDTFTHLNEDVQNALLGNLKNVSLDPLKDENQYNGDVLDFLYGEFLEPLSNLSDKSQQALSDALNADEAEMTAKEYSDKVNSALKTAFPGDKELQKKWKDNFGLSDIIDENDNEIKTLSAQYKDSVDKINSMTNGDREIGYDIVINSDEVPKTFAELEQKIAETKGQLNQKDLSLDAMKQVVTDTTTAYSSLSTAMSESMSNTGMTADSITAVKTALSSLVSENDAFKDASLDGIFRNTADGVDLNTDAMKQLIKKQHDMKVDDFTKSIQLQNEAWKEQQKIIDENKSEDAVNAARDKQKEITSDINAIQQAQSQYYAQYKQMENMFSDYSKWMQSASQETAGTPYNNIVSGLEQAYKDFQNDLVGTDSFKNFAAMISPTGATDPADFEENYAKAKRYLQEGDDGVKNFLNDLKSHDLATFNQETGEWVVKAHSAAEAAKALATGTDVASAAFGKLEDYGFHDNTVDDVQDGILKIGEAYTNLADAKSKLKEMEANPENYSETRIQAQRDEVEAYTKDIGDLTDNMQYYIEHQVEEYQQQKDFAENAVKEMAKYQQEIQANPNKYGGVENANQLSNYLTEQMQGYGEAYGIDAASIQAKAIADAKAYRDALKNASIDNPATPDFGDNEESAKSYASALEKIKGASDEQNQSLDEAVKTLSKFNSEQIKGINLSDGAYDSEELKPAEQALDTIAQTFGLTNDEAAQLGVLLESIGKIKPDTSYFDATNDELTQAQEKLNELTGTDYKFNFDTSDLDTIQQQIDQAKKQLEQFKKDGQVDYSQEGAQEASDIYEASIRQQQNAEYNGHAITQVGSTDTETSQLLSSAREFMQAKNELDVQTQLANEGAENHLEEAQKNAESAYNTFKDLNEASDNKMGLDTSDIQSTEDSLLGLTEDDLKVKVGADTSQAQEDISSLTNVSGSTVEIQCDVSNEESFEQAKSTVESMPKETTATVNMSVSGESDVEKATSLIESAPKNQDSELVINCHVNNKEEYDTIMQAQNEANANGANVTVNATIGEVDTSTAPTSSTPV